MSEEIISVDLGHEYLKVFFFFVSEVKMQNQNYILSPYIWRE